MDSHPVDKDEPDLYEIRLQGRLHERWSGWFDGMTLTSIPGISPDGADNRDAGVVTIVRGPVVDQAALHGMLARLRDVGMPLISVVRVEAEPPRPDVVGAGRDDR